MACEQLSQAGNKARLRWDHLAAGRMDRQRGDKEVTVTTEKLNFLCFLLTKSHSVKMPRVSVCMLLGRSQHSALWFAAIFVTL